MALDGPGLEMTGMNKRYGSVQALRDVEFQLRPGQVMALLGENGAGKSTLVKILAGLVRPDSGSAVLDGKPIDLFPSARSQEAGIAVVHQEFSSVPTLTVAENLILGDVKADLFLTSRKMAAHARPLLEQVGLGGLDPHSAVERLSVGELQLVEVARALSRDARILVFDEPTAALSDREIARVLELIRRLAAQGRSIVYVTHRLPEVFKIASDITIMRNGESRPPVPVKDVDVDKVIAMMLGRAQSSMYPDRARNASGPILDVEDLQVAGLPEPVSFTVRQGEIFGLTGQIGSGASQVVRALAGLVPIRAGSASIEGSDLSLRSRRQGIRRRVAYCSDDRKSSGMFAIRSICDNLSAPWLKRVSIGGWISRQRERSKARDIATSFAIDVERLGSPVEQLSGGNQQKVVLGRWLGAEPQIFLIEEPTRGVDVGARADVYRHLRKICDEGVTVIVASSDTDEVLGLCDTIATLYRGRLQSVKAFDQWSPHELTKEVMHSEVVA